MKKVNKLGFVGCFALFSVFGIISGHQYCFCFLCFAPYLHYFSVIPDEMFMEYVRKSATFGFFTGIIVTLSTFALMAVLSVIEMFTLYKVQFLSPVIVLVLGFAVSFTVFTISLHCYEVKERRLMK